MCTEYKGDYFSYMRDSLLEKVHLNLNAFVNSCLIFHWNVRILVSCTHETNNNIAFNEYRYVQEHARDMYIEIHGYFESVVRK